MVRYGLNPYITQIRCVFRGLMLCGLLNFCEQLVTGLEVNTEESRDKNHFS
jgi:hypothetical protein